MKQTTSNRFAEILAAQQAKLGQIKPITAPKQGEQPVKAAQVAPVISIDELINKTLFCAPTTFELPVKEQAKKSVNLIVVDYSDRAFAIIGDTKPIKDKLRQLGGSFNMRLTCGAGWIFSKRRLQDVKQALELI